MSLQQTLTSEAASVAEVLGEKTKAPTTIVDAAGGATVDAEARTALNALLKELRDTGVIE